MSVPRILLLTGPRAAAVARAALEFWTDGSITVYDASEIYPDATPNEAIGNLMCDTWGADPRTLFILSAPNIGPDPLPVLAYGPAAAAVTRCHTTAETSPGITACRLVPRALGRE